MNRFQNKPVINPRTILSLAQVLELRAVVHLLFLAKFCSDTRPSSHRSYSRIGEKGKFTTKNLEYLTDIEIPSLCTYVRTYACMHECICVDSLDQVGATQFGITHFFSRRNNRTHSPNTRTTAATCTNQLQYCVIVEKQQGCDAQRKGDLSQVK